ncbi:MAG: trans-2-enoyl-CoA reductase family protein [Clostridia bacterium]|nr:trans-2-enoyl-CoA reductase family protein [Clostridia bacterium]
MIVEPKVRGFICTTAHPTGCAESVDRQIAYAKAHPAPAGKNVLVIGCSTGYGLASRIAAAFGGGAATLGVMFERPANPPRTATAGYYNTAAFEKRAAENGLYAKTVNGDAFSQAVKDEIIEIVRRDLKTIDTVVYSLAAPRRTMPDGTVVSSVIKTVGSTYTNKTVDLRTNAVTEVTVTPATQEEIDSTVKVMGGGDFLDWMHALKNAGVLSQDCRAVAYSYIGPALTHPMYLDGTIGAAKRDLIAAAETLRKEGIEAYVSVNKALVTQSSAAIPVVPLYIAILYKVMKKKGTHEGCIEQMCRLFGDKALTGAVKTDADKLIRLDDLEMADDVQKEVAAMFDTIDNGNIKQYADIEGYWDDFYKMFGFGYKDIDYTADVEI